MSLDRDGPRTHAPSDLRNRVDSAEAESKRPGAFAMNRVWMSGKVVDTSMATSGERILILATLDGKPRLILAKYRGSTVISVGDIVETSGELSEQEPVTVKGHIVTGPDGRVAMRNVYRITELTLLVVAAQPAAPRSVNTLSAAPMQTANIANYPSSAQESTDEYNGPEVPWA
jgi:hypothetical protein